MTENLNSGTTSAPPGFPLGKLILLAVAGFLTMLTEALPAGLLPAMAQGLDAGDAITAQRPRCFKRHAPAFPGHRLTKRNRFLLRVSTLA